MDWDLVDEVLDADPRFCINIDDLYLYKSSTGRRGEAEERRLHSI